MNLEGYFLKFEEDFKAQNMLKSRSFELSLKVYHKLELNILHTLKFQIWRKVWSELIENIEKGDL
jgi:hypothetical protein